MNDETNIGDIVFDVNTSTYSICTSSGSNGVSYAFQPVNMNPTPALTILNGSVKIGEFEIAVEHLEVILRQLYDDVRKNNPEHFI